MTSTWDEIKAKRNSPEVKAGYEKGRKSMTTRVKFVCREVTQFEGTSKKVRLTASTNAEDKPFWKYTPNGQLEMTIDNPPASDMFQPGKSYYLDISSAD